MTNKSYIIAKSKCSATNRHVEKLFYLQHGWKVLFSEFSPRGKFYFQTSQQVKQLTFLLENVSFDLEIATLVLVKTTHFEAIMKKIIDNCVLINILFVFSSIILVICGTESLEFRYYNITPELKSMRHINRSPRSFQKCYIQLS